MSLVRVTAQVRNRTGLWAEVKVRATKVRLKFRLGLDSRGHESKSLFQGRIRVTVKVSSRAKGQNLSGDGVKCPSFHWDKNCRKKTYMELGNTRSGT